MSYSQSDSFRFIPIDIPTTIEQREYRSDVRRDYARVLHSPSFRRLENKTQLFPGNESDFFRNRLTHSLEVAQIAKTIAQKILSEYPKADIDPDVCEIAGLIHDLGHPPFGHNGEKALDECMLTCGGFEGNAQTIRIITRLEKKESVAKFDKDGNDKRAGLNLSARVIASALKYDHSIPIRREPTSELVKGYYESEKEIIDKVKQCVASPAWLKKNPKFKTIECSIMDLADDIAYSTYDMEDAFKAGFLTPYEMMAEDDAVYDRISQKMKRSNITADISECRGLIYGIFAEVWQKYISKIKQIDLQDELYEEKTLEAIINSYNLSKSFASDGYVRTQLTSFLINKFIKGIIYNEDEICPKMSTVCFDNHTEKQVNVLKHFSYVSLIESSRLKVAENRGKEIICQIFKKLSSDGGDRLLPEDFQAVYNSVNLEEDKKRLICDFIAGMTDRYALEFYCRLFSENPQSIFKPL